MRSTTEPSSSTTAITSEMVRFWVATHQDADGRLRNIRVLQHFLGNGYRTVDINAALSALVDSDDIQTDGEWIEVCK